MALLVPGVCAAAARVGGSLAPLAVGEPVGLAGLHYPLGYFLSVFVAGLLLHLPLVFAWYGFVDGRLARRVSPLVAALVIGLAIALPFQLAVRVVGIDSWLSGGGWYVLTS